MLRLFGVPITDADARRLVANLIADGKPDALSAARIITNGLDRRLALVALPVAEREAVLDQLEEAEIHGLADLRGRLYADAEQRRRPG